MSYKPTDVDAAMIQRAEELLSDLYGQNSEFNIDLDSSCTISIPGRKAPVGLSEFLFWTDRTAYNDELAVWKDLAGKERHEDALTILQENDQEGVFQELVEAINRSRVAPFVGAGMSFASGFPVWGDSLREILAKVEEPSGNPITAAIDGGDYLDAAELLWAADEAQVVNYIRTKFAESKIRRDKISGAILLLDRISSGCIITTNFDRVIETVVDRLDGYMHGRQPGHNFVANLLRGKRCLLKLHGDTDSKESYVFTRAQYDEAYGETFDFSLPLPKALRQIYISHSLLFLGCGMDSDRTLNLFEHVIREGGFEIPDHFALLTEPAGVETKTQKESRLLRINVRPIWYPAGDHEAVGKLLELAIACAGGEYSL